MLRGVGPVWESIKAGVHNGPRDQRAFTREPVDLEAARRIAVPVLLLIGSEQDAAVYLDGLDELERALPKATRETIPGQHHMAPAFAPDAFAEIVASFLGRVTDERRSDVRVS